MARITITQENMDRSKIIPPGKYVVEVDSYEEQQAGTDGSALYVYQLKVIEGTFKGVTMRYQVSEKAEGMGYEFWEACGTKLVAGVNLDPAAFTKKKCGCFVQRGEYKGKTQNVPQSFYKIEGAPSTEAVRA